MLTAAQREDLNNWKDDLLINLNRAKAELSSLQREVERLKFRWEVAKGLPETPLKQNVVQSTEKDWVKAQNTLNREEFRLNNDIENNGMILNEIETLLS
ncbi:hypothetical protein [Tumebacillus permanentifrigoris]|uniref:Uncharacterized protein n=1 Tax=Tumebacillus permanentifrigoris TaxID=378543 RepID=A0A316D4J9_9BACL|nr:hypothetical protein [Tumebacillus permanentifrigoris]PWK07510.1 hypothetical protein C7459_117109 [Tumebacillus permanentifrigoris]